MMHKEDLPDLNELRLRRSKTRSHIRALEDALVSADGEARTKFEVDLLKARADLEAIGRDLALLSEHAAMLEASASVPTSTRS